MFTHLFHLLSHVHFINMKINKFSFSSRSSHVSACFFFVIDKLHYKCFCRNFQPYQTEKKFFFLLFLTNNLQWFYLNWFFPFKYHIRNRMKLHVNEISVMLIILYDKYCGQFLMQIISCFYANFFLIFNALLMNNNSFYYHVFLNLLSYLSVYLSVCRGQILRSIFRPLLLLQSIWNFLHTCIPDDNTIFKHFGNLKMLNYSTIKTFLFFKA